MKIRSQKTEKNIDAFVAAGSTEETIQKKQIAKKENLQNFTMFLPKNFHKNLKVYSITQNQQMQNILTEILCMGIQEYRKKHKDFPEWN